MLNSLLLCYKGSGNATDQKFLRRSPRWEWQAIFGPLLSLVYKIFCKFKKNYKGREYPLCKKSNFSTKSEATDKINKNEFPFLKQEKLFLLMYIGYSVN